MLSVTFFHHRSSASTSFDWFAFALILLLSCFSLAFIYSTTYQPQTPYSVFFKKQVAGVITGMCIYYAISLIDARTLMRWGFFAYFIVIGFLLFTLIKGHVGMGGQRWIDLFFFKMQPSELTKLLFPAFVSYYLFSYDHGHTTSTSSSRFVPLLITLGISCVLIAKQPDLGTAILLLLSGLITLWMAGVPTRFFVYGFFGVLIISPLLWPLLKEYQKQRIFVFLGQGNSNKERYQIEQSMIAVGSGGMYGKGFMQGTQNRFQFLPESRTDFIYSIICEESGFVGALFIVITYLILTLYILQTTSHVAFPYMHAQAVGLISHCIIAAFINIGMVLGLVPIVGIPLPLVSYGISNLWITYASFGWLASIKKQRNHKG